MNRVGRYCSIHNSVKLGDNIQIANHVVIEENCEIGDNTIIGNGVVLRVGTIIGKDCKIGTQAVSEGNNKIGDRVSCHAQCHMCQGLVIEDDVFYGPYCGTFNTKNINHGRNMESVIEGPIIRRAARIGAGTLIMPGLEIGENAYIYAGSLVTKNVPAREVWMGWPARKVKFVPTEEIL